MTELQATAVLARARELCGCPEPGLWHRCLAGVLLATEADR